MVHDLPEIFDAHHLFAVDVDDQIVGTHARPGSRRVGQQILDVGRGSFHHVGYQDNTVIAALLGFVLRFPDHDGVLALQATLNEIEHADRPGLFLRFDLELGLQRQGIVDPGFTQGVLQFLADDSQELLAIPGGDGSAAGAGIVGDGIDEVDLAIVRHSKMPRRPRNLE